MILLGLSFVPVLHGAVIAGDAAVYLRGFAALGAGKLLAVKVAVVLADGIGGAESVVRQLVVLGYLADKICRRLPVRELFAEEGVRV